MATTQKIDMVGLVFERLTVLEEIKERNKHGHIMYMCICTCGNYVKVLGASLRSSSSKSCGCLQREVALKHGKFGSKVYMAWQQMKDRCFNPKNKRYRDYGGRGITVCSEWLKFENFYSDMGDKPEGLSLDRINNNGNYNKENCKWSTPKEQANNRRSVCERY